MEKKSGNKGLVVLLSIIIVVLVGALGFGAYKYIGLDKDYNDLSKKYESAKVEVNSKTNEVDQSSYDVFVKKMKERRESVYNNGKSIEEYIGDVYTENGENVGGVTVKLDKDGTLSITYKKHASESGKIAENVLFFKILNEDDFQYLYYVTEDGKVYSTIALAYFPKAVPDKYDYKNIVDILPTKDSSKGHIFVDIDGNLYR